MSDTASKARLPPFPLRSIVRRSSTTLGRACEASVMSRLSAICQHTGTPRHAEDRSTPGARIDEPPGPRMPRRR